MVRAEGAPDGVSVLESILEADADFEMMNEDVGISFVVLGSAVGVRASVECAETDTLGEIVVLKDTGAEGDRKGVVEYVRSAVGLADALLP